MKLQLIIVKKIKQEKVNFLGRKKFVKIKKYLQKNQLLKMIWGKMKN